MKAGMRARSGQAVRLRSRMVLLLCAAVSLSSSFAFADWRDFIPRPFENGAYFDQFTSYERDNLHNEARSSRWEDIFLREKITVYSNGYSYHPRFLQYRFSISGVTKQEDYNSSLVENPGWMYGSGWEYGIKLFFLPEHPYNLTLGAARYEPLFKEQAATQHNSIENTRSASFRYRQKPYFFHTGYSNDSIDSSGVSSDVTRFNLDGEYFKRYTNGNELSVTGAFNPSWFSNNQGLDGSQTQYLLGNMVNLKRVRLSSNLTQNSFDQRSALSGRFQNDQLAWYEQLSAYLPYNFRSDVSYRYQDNSGTIHDANRGVTQDLSNVDKNIQLDVVHRLYESLDTTYTFLHDDNSSSGGESTTLSNALAVNYTKLVPWHSRLLVGVNVGRSETSNSGQTDFINEPHSGISVPQQAFTLSGQNVEPSSIVVYLKSPLPPFQAILLQENVNYVVTPIDNTVEIQVLTLPPEFVVPGTYDFLVSYAVSGTFDLRIDTYGSNASLEMFNRLLTPYFSYLALRSDVLSGTFPGSPIDSTTYTTGAILLLGPLRVRGEYQDLQWDVSPYQAWRAELQYVASLSATTSVYATATYLNKHHPRGTSTSYPTSYTEETESGSGNIQRRLFSRNMYVSLGGSYSHQTGLVDTDAYAANASWVWTIGKVDLTVGGSVYGSDSSGTTSLATKRDHELFYLKFRRQLF